MNIPALLIGIPVFMIIGFPVSLLEAWCINLLYTWFVMPTFHEMPEIGAFHMFGILMVINLISSRISWKKDDREFDWFAVAISALNPVLALGMGAIVKFWVMS